MQEQPLLPKVKMFQTEAGCKAEANMLKQDAESSVCTYDKAMRSLPLHTSTQRCDRCTCTHAHTELAQRYDRCWCIHLHSDTIAANAHASTAIRSLFLNTPAQRCNRYFHPHTPTQQSNRCSNMTANACMQMSCSHVSTSHVLFR